MSKELSFFRKYTRLQNVWIYFKTPTLYNQRERYCTDWNEQAEQEQTQQYYTYIFVPVLKLLIQINFNAIKQDACTVDSTQMQCELNKPNRLYINLKIYIHTYCKMQKQHYQQPVHQKCFRRSTLSREILPPLRHRL